MSPDSGTELGALAHALAAHARRRRALGHRAVEALPAAPPRPRRAAPPDPSPSAPSEQVPSQQAPSQQARAPQGASAAPPPTEVEAPGERPVYTPPAARPVRPGRAAEAAPTGPGPADLAPGCATLAELEAGVTACTACPLAQTRNRTVFADGTGRAGLLFVGEGPGAEEDRQGVPFVGRAGALLTDIITKGMGLAREDVAIVNVVKCRPPENRDPTAAEKAACAPWLERQIELFAPRVIVPLGRHAAGSILGVDAPLGRLRGRVHDSRGRRVVPTYHPAYLLRAPQEKKKAWEDIQLAMREAGIPLPGRG